MVVLSSNLCHSYVCILYEILKLANSKFTLFFLLLYLFVHVLYASNPLLEISRLSSMLLFHASDQIVKFLRLLLSHFQLWTNVCLLLLFTRRALRLRLDPWGREGTLSLILQISYSCSKLFYNIIILRLLCLHLSILVLQYRIIVLQLHLQLIQSTNFNVFLLYCFIYLFNQIVNSYHIFN
jgi:hypothetical protein